MQRLERMYAISEEIRRRHPTPVSATTLAERFEVSRRTIERDLAALRNAGATIYGEPGRTGGQHVVGDRRVVLTLSPAEIVALFVALNANPALPFTGAGHAASRRLLDSLPATVRSQAEELRARIRVVAPDVPAAHPRTRRALERAVAEQVVVRLEYCDGHGRVTHRDVDPVGFFGSGDAWYLVGWCHLRAAGRMFRIERVRTARTTRIPAATHDVDETVGWVPVSGVIPE
jgi:predicted DNA-binding transcriptional regulator YafY